LVHRADADAAARLHNIIPFVIGKQQQIGAAGQLCGKQQPFDLAFACFSRCKIV
jgi:hypothetical protein